jgi:hypothetical protein
VGFVVDKSCALQSPCDGVWSDGRAFRFFGLHYCGRFQAESAVDCRESLPNAEQEVTLRSAITPFTMSGDVHCKYFWLELEPDRTRVFDLHDRVHADAKKQRGRHRSPELK